MRSERKMLPIGVENFEKLRRNDMYYVDKTEIIADLLRNHHQAARHVHLPCPALPDIQNQSESLQ